MSKLKVQAFAVSIDGYGAGPDQSMENPLGVGGESLHEWMLTTRTFQQMIGEGEDGRTGVDDDFVQRSFVNHGAWILGRNMSGRCAVPGLMTFGRAGGATTRPSTCRCSC